MENNLKKEIDRILNHVDFREFAESQIGFVKKVEVDWNKKTVSIVAVSGDATVFPFDVFLEFSPLFI